MLANNKMCILKTVVWLHNGNIYGQQLNLILKDANAIISQFATPHNLSAVRLILVSSSTQAQHTHKHKITQTISDRTLSITRT